MAKATYKTPNQAAPASGNLGTTGTRFSMPQINTSTSEADKMVNTRSSENTQNLKVLQQKRTSN